MIEAILILAGSVGLCWASYNLGRMDGEKAEFRKWHSRQWHRPGCSCDDIYSEPQ